MSKKPVPKWRTPVLMVLALAPIALIFGIFLYGNRYQSAFDEETCPFEEVVVRDVILAVGGEAVESRAHLDRLLASAGDGPVQMTVAGRAGVRDLTLEPESR